MWGEEEDIEKIFADIETLSTQCRFRNCRHENDPHCAILNALESGLLDKKRYQNYLKLKSELQYLTQRKKR